MPLVGETTLPSVTAVRADLAVDRRADFGIAEIDLGLSQLRLGAGDLRRQRAFRSKRCYRRSTAGRRASSTGICARSSVSSALWCCASQLLDSCLVSIDLRLKWRLLEEVEQIALLDLGALDKELLFEERADPGNQRHPPDRLNAADELVGLGDLLALGAHDPDRHWSTGRRLSVGLNRKQAGDKGQKQAPGGPFTSHLIADVSTLAHHQPRTLDTPSLRSRRPVEGRSRVETWSPRGCGRVAIIGMTGRISAPVHCR